jgi:hypothetical protein
LGIVGKALTSGFLGGDFVVFRPKVVEIVNFESFFSLEINLAFKYFSHN